MEDKWRLDCGAICVSEYTFYGYFSMEESRPRIRPAYHSQRETGYCAVEAAAPKRAMRSLRNYEMSVCYLALVSVSFQAYRSAGHRERLFIKQP